MEAITRRQALTAGTAAILAGKAAPSAAASQEARAVTKGRLKQSVSRSLTQELFCRDNLCEIISVS
jgi:hypothetical protein